MSQKTLSNQYILFCTKASLEGRVIENSEFRLAYEKIDCGSEKYQNAMLIKGILEREPAFGYMYRQKFEVVNKILNEYVCLSEQKTGAETICTLEIGRMPNPIVKALHVFAESIYANISDQNDNETDELTK